MLKLHLFLILLKASLCSASYSEDLSGLLNVHLPHNISAIIGEYTQLTIQDFNEMFEEILKEEGSVEDHVKKIQIAFDEVYLKSKSFQFPNISSLTPTKKLANIIAELKIWGQIKSQINSQIKSQVGVQVLGQIGDQVGGEVWDQVWDQVWGQVWSQVGDQVWSQVGDQVRDQVEVQVRAQVRDQVGHQVTIQVRAQIGNQQVEANLEHFDFATQYETKNLGSPLILAVKYLFMCYQLAVIKMRYLDEYKKNINDDAKIISDKVSEKSINRILQNLANHKILKTHKNPLVENMLQGIRNYLPTRGVIKFAGISLPLIPQVEPFS